MEPVSLPEFKGFDWNEGNVNKHWESHRVSPHEAEQVFFNHPLVVADDVKHPGRERRYFVPGQTDADRAFFVAFTLRSDLIRVISARDMSRRERKKRNGSSRLSTTRPNSLTGRRQGEAYSRIDKNDVPYQLLVKVFLSERIESELQKHEPQKIRS